MTKLLPFYNDFIGPKEPQNNAHVCGNGHDTCELEHGQNHYIKGHYFQLPAKFF